MSPQCLSASVATEDTKAGLARLWPFLGPALLVSVGYMDPGNWATDLEGGARFGYQLLWVLVACNAVALLLQTLCTRLGLVCGRDLAQACRENYPRPAVYLLWGLAESAIIACDLAEVIGSAVALNLLFGLPMVWGAIITVADVMLVLMLQRSGARRLEAIALVMVLTIAVCFGVELYLVKPHWHAAALGLRPRIDDASLFVAIGILGATVMPHNLYLHSALVKTRAVTREPAARKRALRFAFVDTAISLNLAFLINAAILLMAAAVFYQSGVAVSDLREAHRLLAPLLGATAASVLFAVALLCAGQSATITGTLAGQIIMEGFLEWRLAPGVRRFITRCCAVVPAVAVLAIAGEKSALNLLVLTQIVLSIQLPFAIVPLIRCTSSVMLMRDAASPRWVRWTAWSVAGVIALANGWMVMRTVGGSVLHGWILSGLALYALAIGWIAVVPLRGQRQVHCTDGGLAGEST